MFLKKLEELKINKKTSCLYIDKNETDRCFIGRIVCCNEKYFIAAVISEYGLNDGFVLYETDSIIRIETDGKYLDKILILADYHKTVHENLKFDNDNLIENFISFAKSQNYAVSIELYNSGFYNVQGFVNQTEADSFSIKQVTEYGENDSVNFIQYSGITHISCNTSQERILKILNSDN